MNFREEDFEAAYRAVRSWPFWNKFRVADSGCWEWTGAKCQGYGVIGVPGVGARRAHRVVYEHIIGRIRKGLVLDHLCCNRACVNPYHLDPVSHLENLRRARPNCPTHCPRGHLYSRTNTYVTPKGSKACRKCKVLSQMSLSARARYIERNGIWDGPGGISAKRKPLTDT